MVPRRATTFGLSLNTHRPPAPPSIPLSSLSSFLSCPRHTDALLPKKCMAGGVFRARPRAFPPAMSCAPVSFLVIKKQVRSTGFSKPAFFRFDPRESLPKPRPRDLARWAPNADHALKLKQKDKQNKLKDHTKQSKERALHFNKRHGHNKKKRHQFIR
jgi:hypothetical protein